MKFLQTLLAGALVAAATGPAAADPAPNLAPHGPHWSLTLAGGAIVPLGVMRKTNQDALVAGIRFGVRAQIGIGVELAIDYSPLPRQQGPAVMSSVNYGTVALMPAWTMGSGVLRLQIAGGGGVAMERYVETVAGAPTAKERTAEPAAMGQIGIQLHATKGGGFVLLAGATRTFGKKEYQYAFGMGGLALEF